MERIRDMKELVKETGLSLSEIASMTGLSKTTVSMIINGKYKGSDEAVKRVMSVLERNVDAGKNGGYVTKGQRLVMAVLEDVYEYRDFAVIAGDSGIGKTYTVRRFCDEREDVLYMKIRVRMSYGQILNAMLRMLHAGTRGNTDERLERLRQVLKERGIRMVVVDESDLMASSRESFRHKVEIFRELWDDGEGVAVALVGLGVLYDAIVGLGDTYILSRIGHIVRVPNPSFDEMMEYWEWLTGWQADGEAKRVVELSMERGWYRMMQKVYMRAQKVGLRNAVALLGGNW